MDNLFEKTKEWIKIYSNADHLIQTAYWVKELDPEASDALVLAALTHDIERAFKENRNPPAPEFEGKWDDPIYNEWHSGRSAKFTEEFLKEKGTSEELIKRTTDLVKLHETGGTPEADLLKDADSLSFLEVNTPLFISMIPEKITKDDVRAKLDFMLNRITSEKAKTIAKQLYDKAILELDRV